MRNTALFVILVSLVAPLLGQSPQPKPKFALEVVAGEGSKPTYALVSRGPYDQPGTTTFFSHVLLPLSAENTGAPGKEKPCAVGMEIKDGGEVVSVIASLYFGALTAQMEDLSKHPHQPIGTYLLRLDESVVLEEMKPFGVQPYTIKLVTAAAPRSNTQTLSKVPSLQIAITGEDRTFYSVAVHNLSQQAVIGLVIERSSQSGRDTFASYDDRKPLIPPGGFHRLPINSNALGCTSPDNPATSIPCPIVLEGALFADGTHAGDPVVVADLEASRITTAEPRLQLRSLMKSIVDDSSLQDAEKLVRLREEIPKLKEESDSSAVDQLRQRYPELTDEDWTRIGNSLNGRVQAERQRTLDSLAKYEESVHDGAITESLAQWMRHWGAIE